MKRRSALKNIGLGAGIFVIGPSAIGLLQSCKNEPEYDWEPIFLSASHGYALKKVLNIMLPASDTPGAIDLNIPQFIDSYIDKVAEGQRRTRFLQSADAFSRSFKKEFNKEQGEGQDTDFEQLVKKYLKATPAEKEIYAKRNTETQDAQVQDPGVKIDDDAGAFAYLTSIRNVGIWAWKNSEEIGENVMWYDPVPGEYIPCGSIEEFGDGKTMSL